MTKFQRARRNAISPECDADACLAAAAMSSSSKDLTSPGLEPHPKVEQVAQQRKRRPRLRSPNMMSCKPHRCFALRRQNRRRRSAEVGRSSEKRLSGVIMIGAYSLEHLGQGTSKADARVDTVAPLPEDTVQVAFLPEDHQVAEPESLSNTFASSLHLTDCPSKLRQSVEVTSYQPKRFGSPIRQPSLTRQSL